MKAKFLSKVLVGTAFIGLSLFMGNSICKADTQNGLEIINNEVVKCIITEEKPFSVTVPKGVKSIGADAFSGQVNLKSIKFENPKAITNLGEGAFSGCTRLKSFKLPEKIKVIPNNCFNNCHKLSDIKITQNVKTLGDNSFANCKSIKSLDLSSVTKIGKSTFIDCTNLKSLKLSKNLKVIDDYAFAGCTNLVLSKQLPKKVKYIGEHAFFKNTKMKEIILPNALDENSLGQAAFSDCTSLKKVVFTKSNLRTISNELFSNCKALKEIAFKDIAIKSPDISETAFNSCPQKITIKVDKWAADDMRQYFTDIRMGNFKFVE